MIIHDSKIVFIHIPKTGGTTIEKMLRGNKSMGEEDKAFGMHHRLSQVYERYCGEETPPEQVKDLGNYQFFTVARNPWERYASLYVHDKIAWESIPKNHKRTFKGIDEYMDTSVGEHFFRAIEVNGSIPDNLLIMDFHNLRDEIRRVFQIMGIKPGRIFHENKKSVKEKRLEKLILSTPSFQEAVADLCDKEIELFGYDLPDDD